MSRDPIGMWGDPGQRGNAQSYAGQNPVNRVDPLGDYSPGRPDVMQPPSHDAGNAGPDWWSENAHPWGDPDAGKKVMLGAAEVITVATPLNDVRDGLEGVTGYDIIPDHEGKFKKLTTKERLLCGAGIIIGSGFVFRKIYRWWNKADDAVDASKAATRKANDVADATKKGDKGNKAEQGVDITKKGCFLAGTLVATRDGFRPIEDIQVGDEVLSRDDSTGAQGYKRVVRLFRGETNQVVHLRIAKAASVQRGRSQRHRVGQGKGGSSSDGEEGSEPARSGGDDEQTLRCTTEHPFWVQGRGWVPAGKLRVGDELSGSQGERLVVSGHEVRQEQADHYNFEVEDWHTYFVSETEADPAVWNHNKCPPEVSGGSGLGANSHVDRIADEIAGAVAQADRVLRTGSAGGTRWGHIYQRLRGTGDWKEAMARGNALQQVADQLLRKNEYLRSAGVLFNKGSRLGLRGKKGLLRPDYQVPLANGRWAILDITTSGSARKIGKYADDLAPIRLNVLYR